MSAPKLSVILPNYNHAAYLPRCIEGILDQSYTDLELVVIDDASTDRSREVIEGYARRDPRVRSFTNPKNLGVIATLNRALELARGRYVFGAASDDYVLPGYFEKAMALFASHPEAGVCVGLAECVDDDGRLRFLSPGMWADEPCYMTPREVAPRMTACGVPGPVVWKKAAFLEAGGYHADLRWHGDWFPLQVVAFRTGVCFIPERTSVVREVAESYSANQRRKKTQRAVLQALLARIASAEYRDVTWGFAASGILRQFGPELVRAAATDPALSDVVLPALQHTAFAHAPNLLRETDPEVRAGVAALLGRYGRAAFPLYDILSIPQSESDPRVADALKRARAAIRRALPPLALAKFRIRSAAGALLRALDRFTRPLHHRRMERIELLLADLLQFQKTEMIGALSAIHQQVEAAKRAGAVPAARTGPGPQAPRSAAA
jgi:hypothetical protein